MLVLDIARSGLLKKTSLDKDTQYFILVNKDTLEAFEVSRKDLLIQKRVLKGNLLGVDFCTSEYIQTSQVRDLNGRCEDVCYAYNDGSIELTYKDKYYLHLTYNLNTKVIIVNGIELGIKANYFSIPYKDTETGELYIDLYDDSMFVENLRVCDYVIESKELRGKFLKKQLFNRR